MSEWTDEEAGHMHRAEGQEGKQEVTWPLP